jgi:holo-[acyl-carrier protein] synthase
MDMRVGLDIASVAGVRQSIEEFGDRYLRRIFTDHELAACGPTGSRHGRLACRFAAKEATIKTLRPQEATPPWTSMEVWSDPSGWCEMHLDGLAAELASFQGIQHPLNVSLTLQGDLAAAVVIGLVVPAVRTAA